MKNYIKLFSVVIFLLPSIAFSGYYTSVGYDQYGPYNTVAEAAAVLKANTQYGEYLTQLSQSYDVVGNEVYTYGFEDQPAIIPPWNYRSSSSLIDYPTEEAAINDFKNSLLSDPKYCTVGSITPINEYGVVHKGVCPWPTVNRSSMTQTEIKNLQLISTYDISSNNSGNCVDNNFIIDQCRHRTKTCPEHLWNNWADDICSNGTVHSVWGTPSGTPVDTFSLYTGDRVNSSKDANKDCPNTYVGHPINTTDGNKTRQENDFIASGISPLKLTRYYNSQKNQSSTVGVNWRHSYSTSLTANIHADAVPYVDGDPNFSTQKSTAKLACELGWNDIKGIYNELELAYSTAVYLNSTCNIQGANGNTLGSIAVRDSSTGGVSPNPPQDTIVIERANGNTIVFTLVNSVWIPPADANVSLVQTAAGFTLTTEQDSVEEYNLSGQLVSTTDRKGIQQLLSYNAATGVLESVSDSFGKSLNFAYSGNNLITVTLPDATPLRYGYDSKNNLSTVEREDSSFKTYVYENAYFPNALTGIIDENNQRHMTFSYDTQGRAITSELAGGVEKVTIGFIDDASSTVTDALGKVRTYRFAMINGEKKLTDIEGGACTSCGGSSTHTAYDANGYVASKTDFNGNATSYVNNARGLVTTLTEAVATKDERVTNYTWHPQYALPTCIVETSRTTSLSYTPTGSVETRSVIDTKDSTLFATPASKACDAITVRGDYASLNKRVTSYTYYPNYGLLHTIDGPRTDVNDVTIFEYDAAGNLTLITNAIGQETQLNNYTARGKPQEIIDANGLVTTLTYDVRGRIDVVTVGGLTTDYDFNAVGNLDLVTRADGSFIDYDYDAAHRLTDVRDQTGSHIHYTLDALGNRKGTDIKDASGNLKRTSTAIYNQLGQLEKTIGAALQTTDYILYDNNGNLKHLRDADNKNTWFGYDALNRLETTTNELNAVSTTVYDAQDNITNVTDFKGLTTTYRFDGLGNRTELNSPDTGITQYPSHDENGNVLTMIDAQEQTTSYVYDVLNRIDFITYNDGSTADYLYDTGVNAIGRLSSIAYTDSTGTKTGNTAWTYDVYGRVGSKTETVNTIALTTSYNYNPTTGQLDNVVTSGGHTLSYTYLNAQVSEISLDGKNIMSGITYEPFAAANAWLWGNGAASSRTYNLDGQLEIYTLGSTTFDINYTPVGNIQSITHLDNAANNKTFNYDDLHRLKDYTGPTGSEIYDFDAGSNRIGLTDMSTALSDTYVIDSVSNKLTSITGMTNKTYTYNFNGSVTSDGIHTYGYDARNRLTSVDNNFAVYQHNALGQRVQKDAAGTATIFHYNEQGQLIAEADSTGAVDKEYFYFNNQPIAINKRASSKYTFNTVDSLNNTATWTVDLSSHQLSLTAPAENIDAQFTALDSNWWEEPNVGQATRKLALRVKMPDSRVAIAMLTIGDTISSGRFIIFTQPTTAQFTGNYLMTGTASSALINGNEAVTGAIGSLQWDQTLTTLSFTESTGTMTGDYPINSNTLFSISGLNMTHIYFYSDQQLLIDSVFSIRNGSVTANVYAQQGDITVNEYNGSGVSETQTSLYFIHTDHLGTPRLIKDKNNATIWYWQSDPFGTTKPIEVVDGDANNFEFNLRFAGQYYDVETGLHYNYFRDYDPSTGRYVQSDPIGLAGGLNTYGYVGGNPLSWIDPLGLDFGFSVNPNQAGGNGHTTFYYQGPNKNWYSYDQGSAGSPSSGGDFGHLSGIDTQGGVSIKPINAPPANSTLFPSSNSEDANLSLCALASRQNHQSGNDEYNLYSNNCTDAAADVLSCAGISIHNPAFTIKPNSWIKELTNNPPKRCVQTKRGLRCK